MGFVFANRGGGGGRGGHNVPLPGFYTYELCIIMQSSIQRFGPRPASHASYVAIPSLHVGTCSPITHMYYVRRLHYVCSINFESCMWDASEISGYRDYTVSCPKDELPNCSVGVVSKCGFLPLKSN